MKVLLVQAYLGRGDADEVIFPLGLCYIATALHRHDVEIFDPNTSLAPYEDLEKKITALKPQIVGLSIRNIDTTKRRDIFYYFKTVRPTVQLIKRVHPDLKVILGGPGFTLFAEKIMERIPEADYGIYLEGEESFPKLLDHLDHPENVKGVFFRKQGAVEFTGMAEMPDFADLPIPRRDFLDVKKYLHPTKYTIGIQTKRGCDLKCAYCSYPFLNGTGLRLRPAGAIVDEIEYLIDAFHLKRFTFVDSVINVPPEHAEAICREMIKRRLNVEWSAWFEIRSLTEEGIHLSQEAGCRQIWFSPDAVTNQALDCLRKGISEEEIQKSLQIAKKAKGIRFGYNFFVTPPGQDWRGRLKTLAYFLAIPLALRGRGECVLGWIRIEPHTRMHELAVQEGVIERDTELLPEDEKQLLKLFYTTPSSTFFDLVAAALIGSSDRVIKPSAKRLLRLLKVLDKETPSP